MRPVLAAIALLLTLPLGAQGETYRWVDERGRVHYGDSPPPKARQLRQLDEAAGRVSTIPAAPAEDRQRDRERVLEARIDRLERELDALRSAGVAAPMPVYEPYYASPPIAYGYGAPYAVAPYYAAAPFKHRRAVRGVHAPRPVRFAGGMRGPGRMR